MRPERRKVTVEYKGKTYTGWYKVEKGMITVSTLKNRMSTQLGNFASQPEYLARQLLREMIEGGTA